MCCCDTATTTTLRLRPSIGPTSGIGSIGRSTGSTPSPQPTRERRCGSSAKTGPTGRTPSPRCPSGPIGSPHRWPQKASRPAIVMVMLGNQVELWESMLAVMKLGAVIMPATTALGSKDLADRVGRGSVHHVITNADQVDKFADIPGDFGRFAVGGAPPPWRPYRLDG